jgi:hypothetical protein
MKASNDLRHINATIVPRFPLRTKSSWQETFWKVWGIISSALSGSQPPYGGALFALVSASTHALGWAAYNVHHNRLYKARSEP